MNPSTPTSLQNKIRLVKTKIDQMHEEVVKPSTPSSQKGQQVLRIKFISFLDQEIDKLEEIKNTKLTKDQIQKYQIQPINPSTVKKNQDLTNKYQEVSKERIELQKKLTQLLQRQLKQQQHVLRLQKAQTDSMKEKNRLQAQILELNQKIQKLSTQISNQGQKIKDQNKQINRLITLNHKLNQEKDRLTEDRAKAQKKLHQMIQKYQSDQIILKQQKDKGPKFNIKDTQGLKNVRILTNISSQKKNHQKYIILQLPTKIQFQKIVYGVRLGIVQTNRDISYFDDFHLYEHDPMKIDLKGGSLEIQYIKRKHTVIIDKYKLQKPQIVLMLYGKGDSVLIDETKV